MRRLLVLAVLTLGLVACGSSAAPQTTPSAKPAQIEFGVKGGNLVPFTITISPAGKITELGTLHLSRHTVKSATEANLAGAVQSDFPGLSSRQCKGTLPDVGSRFIHPAGFKAVTVHGGCEAGFEKLWSKLTAAVGLD